MDDSADNLKPASLFGDGPPENSGSAFMSVPTAASAFHVAKVAYPEPAFDQFKSPYQSFLSAAANVLDVAINTL